MPHLLVDQLRFTRNEFRRALEGVTDADAVRRLPPMNCISWNVGHLAWQEQEYWLARAQGRVLLPDVRERFRSGAPASTPPLGEVWAAWEAITAEADPWLDTLTSEALAALRESVAGGRARRFTLGSLMLRMVYHYWYHLGENLAVRQMLGHTSLPEFVGDIDGLAPYRPES